MSYLLDTNACISYLRSSERAGMRQRLAALRPTDVMLCSVVKAELIFGALCSRDAPRNLKQLERFFGPFVSLPFDDRAAGVYGQIRSDLAARGTPIGPNDLLIGAIALAHGATLVTRNTAEFGRIAGLQLEDWESPG